MKFKAMEVPANNTKNGFGGNKSLIADFAGKVWTVADGHKKYQVYSTSEAKTSFFSSGEGLNYIYAVLPGQQLRFVDAVENESVRRVISACSGGEVVSLPLAKNRQSTAVFIEYSDSPGILPIVSVPDLTSVLHRDHGSYVVVDEGFISLLDGRSDDKKLIVTYTRAGSSKILIRKVPALIVMKLINAHDRLVNGGTDAFSSEIRFDSNTALADLIGNEYLSDILIPI